MRYARQFNITVLLVSLSVLKDLRPKQEKKKKKKKKNFEFGVILESHKDFQKWDEIKKKKICT